MNRFRPIRLGATALTAGGLVILASAGSAFAHVSIAEDEVAAGSTALITFQWSHGCDGSPTTEVRIQMPAEIAQVTPTVNANWDVARTMETLDTPIEGSHGEQITERVAEVVYTAKAPLEDGYRDAFVLSVPIPKDAATLYFPTIQTCEAGETAWIEIPADGQDGEELEAPAPSIAVVEPAAEDDGHGDSAEDEGTVP
ncbi:MAG: YcnI family protein, partial [Actinomycetota bacterium]|nr:YcnI family protein [Actinomycetota bacterium]